MLKLGGPLFGGLLSTPYASAHLTANCAGKRVERRQRKISISVRLSGTY
jgi:hypothetical protein